MDSHELASHGPTLESATQSESGLPWTRSRWSTLLAAGLIALAGLAAYANSFSGSFIHDDIPSILENPTIDHLWPIGQVLSPPRNGETVSGRPLLNLSFAIDYAIGGTRTWSYHVTNLVIHVLNGLLLLGILRRTFCLPVLRPQLGNAALGLALAISLLWVLHPLQTESVTYIIQRAESLAAMFYLAVFYCVIRGIESPRAALWYILAVVACFLGMATKETLATVPILVLLYDRTLVSGSFGASIRRRPGLYFGLAVSWRLLLGLVWSTGLVMRQEEFGSPDPWSYACSQPGVVVHYLRLSLWPDPLCLDYGWPVATTLGAVLPGMLIVGLLASATIWSLAQRKPWGFLGAWFLVILMPSSSVVPLAQLAFEHRMYLSLAAVVTAVVVGGYLAGKGLVQGGRLRGRAVLVGEVCLVTSCAVLLGYLTVKRNEAYRSPLSMWQDTVTKAPSNPSARNNLGYLLTSVGRLTEALEHYREAVRLKPDHAIAHNNLANALADSQRLPEAIEHYEKAVRLKPDYAKAHNNLANSLTKVGRPSEAVEHYQAVLRTQPNDPLAHSNLAGVLMNLGSLAEAVEHYQQALKLDPQSAETRNNLAVALLKSDRLPEAIDQFQQASRLNPELVDVQYNLGKALAKAGRIREAIEHGRKAIRLAPDQARVYRFVAWLMATHESADGGNPEQAVELAERACILTDRRDPMCLDTLAAAYASAGRFDEAVATSSEAWRHAEGAGASLAEDIHVRLQLYRDRRTYREPVVGFGKGRP